MKLSKREIVLLALLGVVTCAVGYYLLWFVPNTERTIELHSSIEQKTQDVEDAVLRQTQYALLAREKELLVDDWNTLMSSLPESFDEADVIRRVEGVFAPYTTDLGMVFLEEVITLEHTQIHAVQIRFAATRGQLMEILAAFQRQDTELRITDIYCVLMGFADNEALLEVNMVAEFMVLQGEKPSVMPEGSDA